jgi:PIN domain nuclease of toxin-antitoxin system
MKVSIGKLAIIAPLDDLIKNLEVYQFNILPISSSHILQIQKLEFHHRDPFDRMIISQAIVEKLVILGADEIFDKYDVERIW